MQPVTVYYLFFRASVHSYLNPPKGIGNFIYANVTGNDNIETGNKMLAINVKLPRTIPLYATASKKMKETSCVKT
jgi:hypothetical protein